MGTTWLMPRGNSMSLMSVQEPLEGQYAYNLESLNCSPSPAVATFPWLESVVCVCVSIPAVATSCTPAVAPREAADSLEHVGLSPRKTRRGYRPQAPSIVSSRKDFSASVRVKLSEDIGLKATRSFTAAPGCRLKTQSLIVMLSKNRQSTESSASRGLG